VEEEGAAEEGAQVVQVMHVPATAQTFSFYYMPPTNNATRARAHKQRNLFYHTQQAKCKKSKRTHAHTTQQSGTRTRTLERARCKLSASPETQTHDQDTDTYTDTHPAN
jgi:hypothetical protein